MSPLLGIALGVASLLLAAALVFGLVTAFRRVMHDDGPLPLFDMIKRRPLSPEGHECVANAGFLAPAVRRCAFCGSKEQCRAWLASARQEDYPTFCPNAGLFERGNGR